MKLITLNLWFDNYLRLERSNIFIEYIKKEEPDVIFLQEATLPVLQYIYIRIQKEYPHIHTSIEEIGYGLAIISKKKINKRKNLGFKNTKMGRSLLYGEIEGIIYATTHLESVFGKEKYKKTEQFNSSITLLSKYDKVIFGGDTNLTNNQSKDLELKEFEDVYIKFKDESEKYTYDGVDNPLLKNKSRSRLDRLFTKNVNVSSYKVEKDYVMSDHFALKIIV